MELTRVKPSRTFFQREPLSAAHHLLPSFPLRPQLLLTHRCAFASVAARLAVISRSFEYNRRMSSRRIPPSTLFVLVAVVSVDAQSCDGQCSSEANINCVGDATLTVQDSSCSNLGTGCGLCQCDTCYECCTNSPSYDSGSVPVPSEMPTMAPTSSCYEYDNDCTGCTYQSGCGFCGAPYGGSCNPGGNYGPADGAPCDETWAFLSDECPTDPTHSHAPDPAHSHAPDPQAHSHTPARHTHAPRIAPRGANTDNSHTYVATAFAGAGAVLALIGLIAFAVWLWRRCKMQRQTQAFLHQEAAERKNELEMGAHYRNNPSNNQVVEIQRS